MRRFPDDKALGQYLAGQIAAIVRAKPNALISIAAGTSSFPVFDALKELVQAGKLTFAQASFFGMDEWCGLPQNADGAMADFLRKHFLDAVDFKEVFLFDGAADPQSERARGESFLAAHGAFDVIVFGIGVNGHVALNEPGIDPALHIHTAEVAGITASVAQKYFEEKAPPLTSGITIGLADAAQAHAVWLVANTPAKRDAAEKIASLTAAGTPSDQVPASLVAALPQAEFLVTQAVFS